MNDLEFLIGDTHGSKVVAFPSTHFTLGSGPDCELRFESNLMKGKHAEVFREADGAWMIRDISGSNTVWINGVPNLEAKLEPGALLKVGRAEIAVRVVGKSGPHMTATATPTRNQRPQTGAEPVPDVTFRRSSAVIAAEAAAQSSGQSQNTNTGPSKRDRSRELQPGTVIDNRYKILGKLAAGGMGEVYKAEHVELGKSFAIKVMLPELSNDADFVARFKREAIASSRIGQQNIVDISDFGRTQEGRFYFVMEFIEGRTLASTVRRDGPLSMQRVVMIGLQVARALASAHQQSIVHRDLKPENVMLLQRPGQADFVKVLDFGIAKVSTGHGSGGQTAIGMVVGTPQYMSPEQAAGLQVDPRTDIYALGLILYELVTGRPAFVGETPSILMALQMTSPPPPLEPGPVKPVTAELEALIFHMLQKKVDQRPSSMEEVVTRLDEAMAGLRTATTGVATRKAAETNAALSALVPIVTQLPVKSPTQAPKSGGQAPLTRSGANKVLADQKPPEKVTEDVAPPVDASPGEPHDDLAAIKPNRMPLYAGLVAIAVLTAGAVVFFSRGSGDTPVVVEPPPTTIGNKPIEKVEVAAGQVKINFTSTPDKAEIFEGDVLLGTTPFTLARDKGHATNYRFQLAGHKPVTKPIRYESDTAIAITLEKEAVAAKETKPAETKPAETKPAEAKPAETKPVAAKETKPAETKPAETAPKETKPKEPVAAKEPKESKPPKETKPKAGPKDKGIKSLPEGDSKELKDLPD